MKETKEMNKEEEKKEFTIPEVKSQEITVQNALNSPLCPDDPTDAGVCGLYGG